MKTEKSAKEWFEKLKEPYRSQAIKASELWPNGARKETYTSLSDAIMCDFVWPDGDNVTDWAEIYISIKLGETTYLSEPPKA